MNSDLSDRQLEIIEASGRILMEKGIKGLTTKNLAVEMNFSESALYRHFNSKEAIVTLLIRYLSDNITSRFETIVRGEMAPDAKLLALFQSQFSFFKANPHFIIIILSDGLIDHTENIKYEIQKLMQSNSNHFRHIIKAGQLQNCFNNEIETEYLIHFVMGTFRLQMLKWKLANFGFDIESQGLKTMSNLLFLMKTK